jgi:hypothetical protein
VTAAAITSAAERRRFLLPLALAQFICSFAGSNMSVMISDITEDLDTTTVVRISGRAFPKPEMSWRRETSLLFVIGSAEHFVSSSMPELFSVRGLEATPASRRRQGLVPGSSG